MGCGNCNAQETVATKVKKQFTSTTREKVATEKGKLVFKNQDIAEIFKKFKITSISRMNSLNSRFTQKPSTSQAKVGHGQEAQQDPNSSNPINTNSNNNIDSSREPQPQPIVVAKSQPKLQIGVSTTNIFEDELFKPELSSLIAENRNDPSWEKTPKEYIDDYKTYIWLRPKEIWPSKELSMFKENMDILDIVQGDIGSCYFICSLFGLLSKECKKDRIKRFFITKEVNVSGVYAVKFMKQGQYKHVVVDDYLPCQPDTKKLAFSYCKDGELWIPIIEKCWAKLNGLCYMKIWLGTPQEALAALSEAPTHYEHHKRYVEKDKIDELWAKLKEAEEKKWILTSNAEEIENAKRKGLAPFHAYSIIQIYEFGSLRLLKMRNPWANDSWKGDFSFDSDKWTQDLKQKVDFDKDMKKDESGKKIENGVFFINFGDYLSNFAWTFICKHNDSFIYNYARFKFPAQERIDKEYSLQISNFVTCFIEVKQKTKCFISLHQPPKRYNYGIPEYSLPQGMLILANWNNGNYQYVNSEYINYERLVLEQELEPGEYHIFGRCYWKYPGQKYKLVISTYADSQLDIYELKKQDIPQNWYKSILYDLVLKNGRKKNVGEKIFLHYSLLEKSKNTSGFIIFYVDNKASFKANVYIVFSEFKGLRLVDGMMSKNVINIEVAAKSTKAAILQCIDYPYNVGLKWDVDYSFDLTDEQAIRKYIDSSKTVKKMLDDELGFYKIPYDNGLVLFLENLSSNNYTGNFVITRMENAKLAKGELDESNTIFFEIKACSKFQVHFKVVNRFKKMFVDIEDNLDIKRV